MWRLKVTSMLKNIQHTVFVVLSRIRKTTNYFLQLKNILFFFIRFVLYTGTRYDSVRPTALSGSAIHMYKKTKSDSLTSWWLAKLIATLIVAQGGGEGGVKTGSLFLLMHIAFYVTSEPFYSNGSLHV